MQYRYQSGEQQAEVTLERTDSGFRAVILGIPYDVEVLDRQPGLISIRFAGRPLTVRWADDGTSKWLAHGGCTYKLDRPAARSLRVSSEVDGNTIIRAPMPSQVRAVKVNPGDSVIRGQVILLLEAMKMEIQIKAPTDGRINRMLAVVGQTVDRDQLLAEIGE